MSTDPRLIQEFPQRIPLKVIGRSPELRGDMIADLIRSHLGPQVDGEQADHANCRGAYISYTFWVTLPDEHAEVPLRQAIAALPGVVMQL